MSTTGKAGLPGDFVQQAIVIHSYHACQEWDSAGREAGMVSCTGKASCII